MICFLWILFPSLASMAQAGGSGSGEVVKGAGGMMKGGMAGNAVNPGMLNGIILNGQLPQLVPVGALLLPQQQQQPAAPVNQGNMGGLQGPGIPAGVSLPLAFAIPQQQQPGLPQGQPQLPQTALPLFAVLPQANGMGMGMGMGGLQFPMVAGGQQVQFLSLGVPSNLQQGAGGGQGQGAAAKARVKHSIMATLDPFPTASESLKVAQTPTIRPMTLAERLKLSVTPQRKSV
ncbi:hypothetical protein ACEWY4_006688 [Coilia grayii]|uniref:Uncharacterized protein n=1 Tax=Coilia grayii TaxID=363190 RepID=A0ABD1KE58_9TELE